MADPTKIIRAGCEVPCLPMRCEDINRNAGIAQHQLKLADMSAVPPSPLDKHLIASAELLRERLWQHTEAARCSLDDHVQRKRSELACDLVGNHRVSFLRQLAPAIRASVSSRCCRSAARLAAVR